MNIYVRHIYIYIITVKIYEDDKPTLLSSAHQRKTQPFSRCYFNLQNSKTLDSLTALVNQHSFFLNNVSRLI